MIRRILSVMMSFLMAVPAGVAADPEEASVLSLYSVNVGDADAHLLRCGQSVYLIDTGTEDSVPVLLKVLRDEGITRLDGVILTHTHQDHIGGLVYLLASEIEVEQVYASGYTKKKKMEKNPIVKDLIAFDREPVFLLSGDSLPLDGGTLEVLGPLEKDEKENNNSLVLLASGGGGTILLAGDMEIPEEQSLLRAGLIRHADVLKVGNHGNDDATGEDFLEVVSPAVAVFPTNNDEDPDTPSERILRWMTAHQVAVYQTQETENGVLITLKNGEIAAEMK